MRLTRLAVLGPLALLHACGDRSGSEARPPEPFPAGCGQAWQPVSEVMPWESTSNLVWSDGTLYYTTFGGELRAHPVSGGEALVIAEVDAAVLWLEGDRLLFSGGDRGNQFFALPLAGGTPTLVLDGAAGRAEVGIAQQQSYLRSPTDFYWAESDGASAGGATTLWRAARSGGAIAQIARLDVGAHGRPPYFEGAAQGADALVLGDDAGFAWRVPLGGGSATRLATPSSSTSAPPNFLGIDQTGVYWAVEPEGGAEPYQEREVVLSPADGEPPAPFWSPLPPYAAVDAMWPDGEGGWFVSTSQRYADEDQARQTVWALDGTGSGQRLACSPGAYVDSYILEPPAVTPDAFYFIARGDAGMQIVRVARL